MIIEERLLTLNPYSRSGKPLQAVKGVVIHWVANPGSSALANRNYFEGLKDQPPGTRPDKLRYASAHYIVGLQGEIIRCVPDNEVCYHVGADRYTFDAARRLSSYPNNCTIGIELCHPGPNGQFTAATLESCWELAASLLAKYGLGKDDLWRHYDVTWKTCPLYFVTHPDEWEAFQEAAAKEAASG